MLLKNESQGLISKSNPIVIVHSVKGLSGDSNATTRRCIQRAQDIEQGRLSASRGADNGYGFPFCYRELQFVQYRYIARWTRIPFNQMLDFYHSLKFPSLERALDRNVPTPSFQFKGGQGP